MPQWYYSDSDRNRHGPVGDADMAQLHAGRQLAADTLVWREGLPQWQPWRSLMHELVAAAPATGFAGAAAASPEAGYNPYAMAEPRSPYAPPRAPVHHASAVYLDGHVIHAGFWKRLAAYAIDSVIVGVAGAALGGAIGAATGYRGMTDHGTTLLIQLVTIAATACYYGWFYGSANQATPGKMAIGIKVVRSDGSGCSFWRGFGRHFASLLSALLLCIGYLMAAFTERKQALHDMVCDTVVVDRWAFTAHADQQREELGVVAWVVLGLLALLVAAFGLLVMGLVAAAGAR